MSSTSVGRDAEAAAAAYLAERDFKIAIQNWRTRWCEIDIVAIKRDVTYFVEVKYRTSSAWGSGIEYITRRKLQQMNFAAQFWAATHKTRDYRLSAIELTGDPLQVLEWIPSIE